MDAIAVHIEPVMSEELPSLDGQHAHEHVRIEAIEIVTQKLILVSVATWIIGALYVWLWFASVRQSVLVPMALSLALLLPAALPWLAFRPLVARIARQRAQRAPGLDEQASLGCPCC